jgi:hypothetical protein
VLWAGAALLWAFAGGVPVAPLLGPLRGDADVVRIIDSRICRASEARSASTEQGRTIFPKVRE